MRNNRCVKCGAIIPESRQVCPNCEATGYKRLTKKDWHEAKFSRVSEYEPSDRVVLRQLWELENQIENGTLKEVVRCKDCVYFQPGYVEMENKERRPYTEEEIKNGKFVTMEKGINCGSRCERFRYWNENQYPVWFNENDFCSYGKRRSQKETKGVTK